VVAVSPPVTLAAKRGCDHGAHEVTTRATWPPPSPYWITRDSSPGGVGLDDCVDVWLSPPARIVDPIAGAFWMSVPSGWDLSTRFGRYTVTSMRTWLGTVADTSLECIRVG
jgi:hypothetical protein